MYSRLIYFLIYNIFPFEYRDLVYIIQNITAYNIYQ